MSEPLSAEWLREREECLRRTGDIPHTATMPATGAESSPGTSAVSRAKVSKTRGMNQWERLYAQEELEPRRLAGEVLWYGFEAMKIRLADGAHYTPDFAVLESNGVLWFAEVKGFKREAAVVRFKVAAESTPFEFRMYRKKKIAEGGGWELMMRRNGDRKIDRGSRK